MEFEFVPLKAADIPMLNEWLARPHVAEWWDEQVADAELHAQYFTPDPSAPGTRYYIAWLDGRLAFAPSGRSIRRMGGSY